MNKILKWLSGFIKKEYSVDLPTEFNPSNVDMEIMNSLVEFMTKSMTNISCKEFTFAIHDFVAEKYEDEKIKDLVEMKQKSVYTVKVTIDKCCTGEQLIIVVDSFCVGIDDKLWRFKFTASMTYSLNDYKDKMISILIDYINGFIETISLSVMCKFDMYIDMNEFNSVYEKEFTTKTMLCCNTADFKYTGNVNVIATDTFPDHYIAEDDGMIVDVIRRKTIINIPSKDIFTHERKVMND